MAITELCVSGYRSIRQVRLPLRQINVLTGPNGCGKSNLYNAVVLLARAAAGGFAAEIAGEGGMPSVLWAGVQKRFGRKPEPRRVILSVRTGQFAYELQVGLPRGGPPQGGGDDQGLPHPASQFLLDPEIKSETVSLAGLRGGKTVVLERRAALVSLRNAEARMVTWPTPVLPSEPVLSQILEPHLYPELSALRSEILRWRFYDHFRTDTASPIRQPRAGVLTPVLSASGVDLAAALETIVEIGAAEALHREVDRAFPGARIEVRSECTRFRLLMHVPGVLRPLEAQELSDGTLRYLCLVSVLLSPRPPELLALNEPETGMHPDLIPALAQLMAAASKRSQLWITTHSPSLGDETGKATGIPPIRLAMTDGETRVVQRS